MDEALPTIGVLGASGLIGEAMASMLRQEGFPVVPMARRLNPAQKALFGAAAVECPLVGLDRRDLARLLAATKVDIVLNCIGVLQDGPRGKTGEVHGRFVDRLIESIRAQERPVLLIHLSIPGRAADDRNAFSLTKRAAERAIRAGTVPFVILRPGFVVAQAAYGGGALIRALAALPVRLPSREADRPFAATHVSDISRTVAIVARRWAAGERDWREVWDVMAPESSTVGGVISAFRTRFGGPPATATLPSWLLRLGSRAGDFAALLGWSPPIRSTALEEMRRGVEGDPRPWIASTGIAPTPLSEALQRLPATVQEQWFARLYLVKALVLATLVAFWSASGLIALTIAFEPAAAILTAHGLPVQFARAVTSLTSLADIALGFGIAFRKTCRAALLAGIALALSYMAGAALFMPEIWIEPLGSLVKTGPAIVLMIVALAILPNR